MMSYMEFWHFSGFKNLVMSSLFPQRVYTSVVHAGIIEIAIIGPFKTLLINKNNSHNL